MSGTSSDSPKPMQTVRSSTPNRAVVLAELRGKIAKLEGNWPSQEHAPSASSPGTSPWSFDIAEVDRVLPEGGLKTDGLHEIAADAHGDTTAATGFALGLVKQLLMRHATAPRPVLWCQNAQARHEWGRIYGHGLRHFGIDPGGVLFVDAGNDLEALWAIEEGARAGCLAAVIGEVDQTSFTQTQRLNRAASEGRTPVLLLHPPGKHGTSAALTRWRIARRPGEPAVFDERAPHGLCWQATLERCRGGRPNSWTMEWSYEAYSFRLATGFSARQIAEGERAMASTG